MTTSIPLDRPNLLVTGPPQSGKTTLVRRTLEVLADTGVAGIFTEPVHKDNRIIAYRMIPVPADEARIFAHESFISQERSGGFGVDVESIHYVADVHLGRMGVDRYLGPAGTASVAVIDEIAQMQCFSHRFIEATRALLNGPIPVVATLSESGHNFMAECRRREDVALLNLTPDNRAQVLDQVLAWVRLHTADRP